jgi:hypothetical protein
MKWVAPYKLIQPAFGQVVFQLSDLLIIQSGLAFGRFVGVESSLHKKSLKQRVQPVAFSFHCRSVGILQPEEPAKLIEDVVEEQIVNEVWSAFQDKAVDRVHRNEICAAPECLFFFSE